MARADIVDMTDTAICHFVGTRSSRACPSGTSPAVTPVWPRRSRCTSRGSWRCRGRVRGIHSRRQVRRRCGS